MIMKMRLNFLCLAAFLMLVMNDALSKTYEELNGTRLFVNSIIEDVIGKGMTSVVISIIVMVLIAVPLILGLLAFWKFVIHINEDEIFVKKNYILLRWTGNGILLYNVLLIPFHLLADNINKNLMINSTAPFTSNGGQIQLLHLKDGMFHDGYVLFFAFFCLIIAEAFAIGIKLKEEQELTI